jgi:glycerol-3-phosphate dehydrogenase
MPMSGPAPAPSVGSALQQVGAALPAACDLLVVGGGVNGAGIARDAAGRGLRVVLVEQHDLASHTSSASTKLIHGGLRYLEFMQFGLVRKALAERETLFGIAPHIMWPLRFVMPHEPSLRPAWMIRAGLFLYDHLARRRHLEGSEGIDLRRHPAGAPLREGFARGFEYSDGWVDDARLVVLNALDAAERGGAIATRTCCTALDSDGTGGWVATLQPEGGRPVTLRARAVVNAAGPWAARLHDLATPGPARHGLRLVKGSHVVVPKMFEHPYAYIFQASDRRIVFAIPYEDDFTLIGTTDVEHRADPAAPRIDAEEIAYLCREAGRYFRSPLSPTDVVWTYSGVRPLLEDETSDARAVSRDYALVLDTAPAPLLSVFGGKITTYRTLAEEAVSKLAPLLGCHAPSWTGTAPLPGGDLAGDGRIGTGRAQDEFEAFVARLRDDHPWLPPRLALRFARAYGSRARRIIGDARSLADLGAQIAPFLYARELDYLADVEWARTAEDALWRRSKLGLHLPPEAVQAVADWFADRTPTPTG